MEKNSVVKGKNGTPISKDIYEEINLKLFSKDEFRKSNNFIHSFYSHLHLNEQKIINRLIFLFSSHNTLFKSNAKQIEHYKNIIEQQGYWEISFQDMLVLLDKIKISKSKKGHQCKSSNLSVAKIKEHLCNIRNSFMIYQKVLPEERVETYTSFIVHFDTVIKNDDKTYFRLHIDKKLYKDLFSVTKIGYSVYNIKNLMKIRSKIGLALFDEINRIIPLKKKRGDYLTDYYKENHVYTLKQLNEMFGTNFKYMSKLKEKLLIQYKRLVDEGVFDGDYFQFEFTKDEMRIKIERLFPMF